MPNLSLASAQLLMLAQLLARAHTPPRPDHEVVILDENEPLLLPLPRSETSAFIDAGR